VEDFSSTISPAKDDDRRAIVLFASVTDAMRAFRSGFEFSRLNLGNVYNENCRRRLSSCVQLDEGEVASLKELLRSHVRIELQRVPKERPVNLPAIPDIMDGM